MDLTTTSDHARPAALRALAQQLRVDAVRAVAAAGSGHPTSALSAADLMAVLLANHLRYHFDRPEQPGNDHLIFSKGHASPRLPWVDVATGSLGLGLPVGVGLALAGKALETLPYRVWVLTGDSELAEGSMCEAFARAGHAGLDNLVAILDVNRLGQSGETMLGWDTATYATRLRAFGWRAIEIDGHDVEEIDAAYDAAAESDGHPVAIVARTVKGKGVAMLADRNGFHGKPVPDPRAAIKELGGRPGLLVRPTPPPPVAARPARGVSGPQEIPAWERGELVAGRRA